VTAPIRIAVAGALGRMGQTVAGLVEAGEGLELVARFDRPEQSGEGLVSAEAALSRADVVIDFTSAAASADLAAKAAERGVALVIGSTGFDDSQIASIAAAAEKTPLVRAGNFSLGVNLLMGLAAQAARALPAEFDIEVFEAHHSRKVDAPSGTALMLGGAAAEARGQDIARAAKRVRDGIVGERTPGEIGFSVVRGGDIIGDHSVIFAGPEEVITLSHSARSRTLFARGAVAAARWVVGRPPAEYDMQDVLGLK